MTELVFLNTYMNYMYLEFETLLKVRFFRLPTFFMSFVFVFVLSIPFQKRLLPRDYQFVGLTDVLLFYLVLFCF